MIGVVIKKSSGPARPFCEALQARGILAKETHDQVIRFAPPLVIPKRSPGGRFGDHPGGLAGLSRVVGPASSGAGPAPQASHLQNPTVSFCCRAFSPPAFRLQNSTVPFREVSTDSPSSPFNSTVSICS
jgi:hypothetical protein